MLVYNGTVQLEEDSLQVLIEGTALNIDAPMNIKAGIENAYKLEAVRVPMSTKTVIFEWSFGIGEVGVGTGKSATLPVYAKNQQKLFLSLTNMMASYLHVQLFFYS